MVVGGGTGKSEEHGFLEGRGSNRMTGSKKVDGFDRSSRKLTFVFHEVDFVDDSTRRRPSVNRLV